jgi:hypothetical protein
VAGDTSAALGRAHVAVQGRRIVDDADRAGAIRNRLRPHETARMIVRQYIVVRSVQHYESACKGGGYPVMNFGTGGPISGAGIADELIIVRRAKVLQGRGSRERIRNQVPNEIPRARDIVHDDVIRRAIGENEVHREWVISRVITHHIVAGIEQ